MRRVPTLAILAVVWLTAASVWGQTTTGRLIGRVTDGEGAPLTGVSVTIASPALIGGPQSKVTDEDGEYSFVGIAPGEYVVRAALDGFITQERAEVKVWLGGATALTIVMPQGRFTDEITVKAETPVVDPIQSNMEQVFDRQYLDRAAIGSAGRSYIAVLSQAAGADGGGDPSVFGSTIGENAYYIDGVDTTDPRQSTHGLRFNFDAIQEIQLQTAGHEAEFGRAIGGVVNLVTRSGGNSFSGTADLRYRDDALYESGEHFDSGELENERYSLGLTLGGPLIRDRLWFFAAYEHRRVKDTPVASPTTTGATARYPLAKLSWQIDPSWRLVAKYSGDPTEWDNVNASAFNAPEATAFHQQDGRQASVELNAVLSDTVLWTVSAGLQSKKIETRPQDGDISTPGHINWSTGERYINYEWLIHSDNDRDELATDLSWFVDDVAGAHELKLGAEFGRPMWNNVSGCYHDRQGRGCEAGAQSEIFEDVDVAGYIGDRDPYSWLISEARGSVDFEGVLVSGFVQDGWRAVPGLTLKLGVRYDTIDLDDNEGTTVATLDKLQPRLGFAWDLTGDARNVVRGSWGRFMHPANLSLPQFMETAPPPSRVYASCTVVWAMMWGYPTGTAEECERFAQLIGRQYRTDPDGWDPAGWILAGIGYSDPTEIDPDLGATYADEWLLSYERALWDRSSVEISYVNKRTRDVLEDTCRGNFPGPPSEDADCDGWVIFNHPERDYQGAVLRFETRTLDWLTLLASYTYSHSRGSADTRHYWNYDFDYYPENWVNRYGYLNNQRRHRVKVNGFVLLPADMTLSVNAVWADDFRYTPYTEDWEDDSIESGIRFDEPRGNRTANDNYQIDLQFSKGFTLGTVRLELIASIYNLLSSERPTGVCERSSGCGNPEGEGLVPLGAPIGWQEPRSYELGFRVEF